ncbi:hypothetical protein K439DRAFT_1622387 [Ramaria rubella]|nr:hypothetical protein K439DRAFT_1622387 [Ramaria rubella]
MAVEGTYDLHIQRHEQARVSEMEAKVAALTRELVTLQNGDIVSPASETAKQSAPEASKKSKVRTSGRDRSASDSQAEAKSADKICQLSGKFAIMYMLWMTNTQASFQTNLNTNYSPLDHFKPGIKWKQQGEQADLHKVFPDYFHADFIDDYIHPIFNTGMNNEHSNSSSHIRTCIGPRIFGYPPESFVKPNWHYDNCRTLVGWKENADGTAFYTPFAPIFYCDNEGRPDINKAFLNHPLFDIFNVIIRGPGALDCEPGSKSVGAVTMDIIWDLKEVTPGAIAASGIFACFALSNDSALQRQGSSSKIDYEADFNIYLKITGNWSRKYFTLGFFFPSTAKVEVPMGVAPAQAIEDVFAALYDDNQDENDNELNTQVPMTVEHQTLCYVPAVPDQPRAASIHRPQLTLMPDTDVLAFDTADLPNGDLVCSAGATMGGLCKRVQPHPPSLCSHDLPAAPHQPDGATWTTAGTSCNTRQSASHVVAGLTGFRTTAIIIGKELTAPPSKVAKSKRGGKKKN